MSAFNWMKRLRKDESGNVLIVGAAVMPMLMGSAALAIDTVQLTLWKRQLQRTADSAAIAGAYALAQSADSAVAVTNDLDENIDTNKASNERPTLTQTVVTEGSYADGTVISGTPCAARGTANCFEQAVEVRLTAERTLPFMYLFTQRANTLRAEGTAALLGNGDYCMVSLYNGTDPGIVAGGNSNLKLGCGMITNSRATNALRAHGSATIEADPAAAVGGIDGGGHFVGTTHLQPYSAPAVDPFAGRNDPELPSECGETLDVGKEGMNGPPLNCYKNWNIQGELKLPPGTYYVNDGVLDIKGKITGEGVTIVLMGDNSDMNQNGGGILDISSPDAGNFKGIALWRDRHAAYKEIKINGGADTTLKGAIYMPTTDIWINGNADIKSTCLQLIGRILTFKGGGDIKNQCTANTGAGAFRQTVVRLVA